MSDLRNFICDLYRRRIIVFDLGGIELAAHRRDPEKPRSPLYYNLRTPDNKSGLMTLGDTVTIAKLMSAKAKSLSFQGLAPIPEAATPLAKAMQNEAYTWEGNPSIPVLLFEKDTGKLIRDCGLVTGNTLLPVDDVISDGRSKQPYITSMRMRGYRVTDCIVFSKRSQKGEDYLRDELGVKLHWVTTAEETLNDLVWGGCITAEQRDAATSMLLMH